MQFYEFNAKNPLIHYEGRVEFVDDGVAFTYGGCVAELRFKGKGKLNIQVKNRNFYGQNWIGVVLDGVQQKLALQAGDEVQTLTLAGAMPEKEHTLLIFKRMGAAHYFTLLNIQVEEAELLDVPAKKGLKLEVYGDSVSQGEVCEAIYYEAQPDPAENNGQWDNSYFGYPWILARKLGGELYNNSQGGIALLDNTGYFDAPNLQGLVSTYDKSFYTRAEQTKAWDFSRYTPDVVIMAIGQNDAHPNPQAIYDDEYAQSWKNTYKKIIVDLQKHYPKAKFILMTTILMHDEQWDRVLDEIQAESNENVLRYRFKRNGSATPGHPRLQEQQEMADELYAFIANF